MKGESVAASEFTNLLAVLCCPKCFGGSWDSCEAGFVCVQCASVYPLNNGVLLMGGASDVLKTGVVAQERRDWDKNAAFYLREAESPLFRLLNSRKVRTFGLDRERAPLHILDFGAGTGFFSKQMISWGHVPITLDMAVEMLRLGSASYDLPLPLQAVSPPLPFRNGSFDAVVANGVLHHCKAQHTLVETAREIRRVLKPGGLLLVYDRNGAFLGKHIHHFVLWIKQRLERGWRFAGSASSHEPDFNDADLRSIMDVGFRIERRRFVSTVFTFMGIVASNTVEYAGLRGVAQALRIALYPFLALSEKALSCKWFTVEQCIRFVKI